MKNGVSLSDGNSGTLPGIDNTITQTSGSVILLDADGWLSVFLSSAGRIPNPKKYDVYKLDGFKEEDPFLIINYASSSGVKVKNESMGQENVIWLQSAISSYKADSIREANLQKAKNRTKYFGAFTIDSAQIGVKK